MRYSRQREAIIYELKNTTCHPNAEWIHSKVRESIPSVSLGTVYRNLRELSEEGELLTLETEQGRVHYDGDTSTHAHFICCGCGRIFDIFKSSGLKQQLESDGFMIKTEKLIFYGQCKSCADKNKTTNYKN